MVSSEGGVGVAVLPSSFHVMVSRAAPSRANSYGTIWQALCTLVFSYPVTCIYSRRLYSLYLIVWRHFLSSHSATVFPTMIGLNLLTTYS
jgi:hypothetical protein